ncbi:putative Zinc finger, ZZ-type, EF-hand domain, EF-hand domain pair, EF-Hand 1, calcium-binding [Septoria linicola]|nr:putative Zinc finger, ZZ-type, EF-hand domain, EF-hand domain pair, EF-Hand 1, calcium-binding [Septoria linicola]
MSQQSSDVSRYRLATWALGVAALGYASYTLYDSYRHLPNTDLRRSNAVHRQRRDRHESRVDWETPSPEAPLGIILIRTGQQTLTINLANTRLPSADMLRRMCGSNSEAIRREIQSLTLDMILSNCFASVRDQANREALGNFGLEELLAALANRDGEQILTASYNIPQIMHLDTVNRAQVERAVATLLVSDPWFTGNASGSDDENIDPAETEDWDKENSEPSQGLRGLLYYIAENEAKRKAYEHRGIGCEECGELPIRGVRWHCLNCPDFDLCSSCEAHSRHPKTHVFAKVKIPVPVLSQPTKEMDLWYPGDPRKIHAPIDTNLKKRLCQQYDYEEPQLDALYDQFTCLANVPWERDPEKVRSAIDRRAFNKAMTSDRWPAGLATNAMFDRMFAFYDTDSNGLIGFEEYVNGMAYLRGPKRFASLTRSIQGYDLDGDGYIDRADFLRILRAKHTIQKQLISDQIDFQEKERVMASMGTLRSNQPISSIFTDEQIPPGEIRRPSGKRPDTFGDLQPLPGSRTVLNDDDPFVRKRPARERLRATLSRFEELLNDVTDPGRTRSEDEASDHGSLMPKDVVHATEDEVEDPYLQNLLWQITENGFNELLDPVFKAREEEDAEIARTRSERQALSTEIHDAIAIEAQERQKMIDALQRSKMVRSAARTSPTTGNSGSLDSPVGDRPERIEDGIVPTDWVSLERREAEIADAPLEYLLKTLGYGVRSDANTAQTDTRVPDSVSSVVASLGQDFVDTTLPQHRPERSESKNSPPQATQDVARLETSKPPSKARLNHLARLNDLERGMDERGGPGRLAYDEIEHIVVADGRHELRGMVKSWLEWASF